MSSENKDTNQTPEEDNQVVSINKNFTPSEAYEFAISVLYSPQEDRYYIDRVISLYKKCIEFPVSVQIQAIDAINKNIDFMVVKIQDEMFKFNPFDILFIQFSRLIDHKIRSNYEPIIQDYEDSFSYLWVQVYKNLNKYDPTLASPTTFINNIIWRRLIDQNRTIAIETNNTLEIKEDAWEIIGDTPFEPDIQIKKDTMELALDTIKNLLTEDQIQLLNLKYVDGLRNTEIAEIMCVTRSRIGQKLKEIHNLLIENIVPLVDSFEDFFIEIDLES